MQKNVGTACDDGTIQRLKNKNGDKHYKNADRYAMTIAKFNILLFIAHRLKK